MSIPPRLQAKITQFNYSEEQTPHEILSSLLNSGEVHLGQGTGIFMSILTSCSSHIFFVPLP